MNTVFKFSKVKPLIKFNRYKFVGSHNNFENINYYIKYNGNNNYDFMEAKIARRPKKLFKKYELTAGTTIKVLDSLMFSYLKHRKENNVLSKSFIKNALEEAGFPESINKYYTTKVPKEISELEYYKKAKKNGYKILYCMNNEAKDKKFANVYLVLVKDEIQKWVGEDISYVNFKMAEFTVKPSYIKNGGKDKYFMLELPSLNIPTSILK